MAGEWKGRVVKTRMRNRERKVCGKKKRLKCHFKASKLSSGSMLATDSRGTNWVYIFKHCKRIEINFQGRYNFPTSRQCLVDESHGCGNAVLADTRPICMMVMMILRWVMMIMTRCILTGWQCWSSWSGIESSLNFPVNVS